MNFLRTSSTRRLIAGPRSSVALVVGGVAAAPRSAAAARRRRPSRSPPRSTTRSPRPSPSGVTARITFTNHLIATRRAAGPARRCCPAPSGRLWCPATAASASSCSPTRATRRSPSRRPHVTVYDASTNTVYRARSRSASRDRRQRDAHTARRRVAAITRFLAQLASSADALRRPARHAAGQPAYTVADRAQARRRAHRRGRARLGRGATARRCASRSTRCRQRPPVLELDGDRHLLRQRRRGALAVTPPAGAKIVDLVARRRARHRRLAGARRASAASAAVCAARALHARGARPARRPPPHDVRLVGDGKDTGAARDLRPGPRRHRRARAAGRRRRAARRRARRPGLPEVAIGGADRAGARHRARHARPVERGGVRYTLIGSVPPAAAEAAAAGGAGRDRRRSRPAAWSSATATSWPSTASTSPSSPGTSTATSGPTARARRRRCACCSGSSPRPRAGPALRARPARRRRPRARRRGRLRRGAALLPLPDRAARTSSCSPRSTAATRARRSTRSSTSSSSPTASEGPRRRLLARHAPAARHRRGAAARPAAAAARRARHRASTRPACATCARSSARLAVSGITVLLSSHLLTEVEELCNRVAIIRTGRIVFEGALDDLRTAGGGQLRCARPTTPAPSDLREPARASSGIRAGPAGLRFEATEEAAAEPLSRARRGRRGDPRARAATAPRSRTFLPLTEDAEPRAGRRRPSSSAVA